MTRKVCIITGSRADYGHLTPVMAAVKADPALTLQTLVCGQHLDPRFGETWKAIEADGFVIDGRVPVTLADDSALSTAVATGGTVSGIARELARLRPDIILVLGDRFEILAAGVAALLLGIPIAHLHGGEITEGAFDDAMRHALSKMAALHFVAAEPYGQRLIQMGEDPARVIVSGAPGLDDLASIPSATADSLAALGLKVTSPLLLITYHPVTLAGDRGHGALEALLSALTAFPKAGMIFTGVNSDPGNAHLSARIAGFVKDAPDRRVAVTSLGRQGYLAAMKSAAAVVGNSSSGVIEAPALHVPTVNIGDRQKGRLRSASIIDCAGDEAAIKAALDRALDPTFRASLVGQAPAYPTGGAAERIAAVLKDVSLTQLSTKRFHDIIPSP